MTAGLSWADEDSAPVSASAPVSTKDQWNRQVIANLNLNQAAFSNWQQGGSNFISWQGGLNASLEHDNPSINWMNKLKLAYGLTTIDGQGTRKSADEINLESVYAWKTWPQVNPFVSFTALTQFDAGFDYTQIPVKQTSAFLDPGYFTESAGLKYIPDPVFNTRLGLKETVAGSFATLETDDPATAPVETSKVELGLSSVSELNLKLSKTSLFSSKLDLFWNGQGLDRTVASWDNMLSVSLDKIISLNCEYDFRYDPVAYYGWQTKETLGIGFSLTLL